MPGELNEQQIKQTAILLGLPADFIRKDYFVTKAIRLLTQVQNEYFELVFQGARAFQKDMELSVDYRKTLTFASFLNLLAHPLEKMRKGVSCGISAIR